MDFYEYHGTSNEPDQSFPSIIIVFIVIILAASWALGPPNCTGGRFMIQPHLMARPTSMNLLLSIHQEPGLTLVVKIETRVEAMSLRNRRTRVLTDLANQRNRRAFI